MISHIVMWKLKENANEKTKAENAIELQDKLEALFDDIENIISIEVGINSADANQDNYDVVLVSEFDTFEDLKIYNEHPSHNEVAKLIGKIVEPGSRRCVDYEF